MILTATAPSPPLDPVSQLSVLDGCAVLRLDEALSGSSDMELYLARMLSHVTPTRKWGSGLQLPQKLDSFVELTVKMVITLH